MYSVGIRDHVMIAHSFQGGLFGPAQRLHGATYVVDVTLRRPTLTVDNVVVDIGRASDALKRIVGELAYRNLDELDEFRGINTTTEFLSRHIFDRMVAAARAGELGPGGEGVESMTVTLNESHVAWASYEGPVRSA